MKSFFILAGVVGVVIAIANLFEAQELVETKQDIDACLNLERSVLEMPEPSPEDLRRIKHCNQARLARLGLDQPSSGFLGNTDTPPTDALAHYEGTGGVDYFTVYDERIAVKSSLGYPTGKTTIPFREIQKLVKDYDAFGTIEIEFKDDRNDMTALSISLFSPAEAMRPEGQRDLDRLYQLLERQRQKYQP